MIDRIRCNALTCTHNADGHCASGAVDIQPYVGPGYSDAYCNSYAPAHSLRSSISSQMPYAATAVNMQARLAGMSECNTLIPTGFISCTAEECRYNRSCCCDARQVHITAPAHNGTLCICSTYQQ
ncbi:MAG: DUF1540 domain-containing protein [Clostridia bacterium]|nr:DUF1540 domain-containing protein [Clostridia bacterium]